MSRFYLGTHQIQWLDHAEFKDIPLFISRRRLCERKTFPVAAGAWALDSGGFSELTMEGRWTLSAIDYVAEVRRYRDAIGGMEWAAIQDWMCEPQLLRKTGLGVNQHILRTVESYLRLQQLAPEMRWVPVLQGWTRDDYLRCADHYRHRGVKLETLPLVGIGSVCRRQHTLEVESLIREFSGIKMHGFGFKTIGLGRVAHLLKSSDSMAWSFAGRRNPPLPGHEARHINCANCKEYALRWRDKLIASTSGVH